MAKLPPYALVFAQMCEAEAHELDEHDASDLPRLLQLAKRGNCHHAVYAAIAEIKAQAQRPPGTAVCLRLLAASLRQGSPAPQLRGYCWAEKKVKQILEKDLPTQGK